jgi:peptidoglycan hydrolase-like protein with peptidoglycan-binding domain
MKIGKYISAILLITALFVGIYSTSYSETIDTLETGLVGFWKFDAINSATFTTTDSSSNNNTGTVGTTSRLVAGKFGQAMKFDENVRNQYMTTGQPFSSAQWSVSAWVNPEFPVPLAPPYNGLITFFSTDVGGQLLGIQKSGVYMYTTKITSFDFANNPGWHNIVVTYDGTNLSAIVDDSVRGSIPYKNLMAGNTKRYVGVNVPEGTYHMFKGMIDETRLYNRVLTGTEITSLFNNVPNTPVVAAPIVAPVAAPAPAAATNTPIVIQAVQTQPSTTLFKPKNNAPKDLFTNIQNEIDSRINSLVVNNTTKNLWEVRGNGTGGWKANTANWTTKGTPLDWTGVSAWNSDFNGNAAGYYKVGTLVSPRHIVFANHFRIENGSSIIFIDKNGVIVSKKVAAYKTITGTDIAIALLDSDVPSTISFYPVLTKSQWETYLKDGSTDASLNLPFILFDKEDNVLVHVTNKNKLFDPAATAVNHDKPAAGKRLEFSEDVISGDSGNPGFVLVGGQPVLIFTNFDVKSSPALSYYFDQINAAMTSLGGGYQLSTLDLSGFAKPTTNTTAPPTAPPASTITATTTLTTDKTNYKFGDTMLFKAVFTLRPEWVTWMKSSSQTEGNVVFTLRDTGNTNIIQKSVKFAPIATAQTITSDFLVPNTATLAGKTYILEVSLSDSTGAGEVTTKINTVSIVDTVAPPVADSLDLTKGLKAYWKFDTITNGTTPDESGTGNTGIVQNNPPLVAGKFGQAISFNTDTVKAQTLEHSVDMTKPFSAAQWTVSLWVNPANPFPLGSELPSKGALGFLSTDPGSQLLDIQKDGVYMFYTKIVAYDFANNPGWHHVIVSYNGTELSAIVDGSIKGSIPFVKNILANAAIRKVGIINTSKTFSFKGAIDEFRIYDRLLSLKEVATLYDPDAKVVDPLTVKKVYPPATLPSWTGYTHIEVNLNRNGWCKASTEPGKSYDKMEIAMNTTAISKILYNVLYTKPGDNLTYYIRCSDTFGNTTKDELAVNFAIDRDTEGPEIIEVNASAVRETTAEIVWSTKELANSRVEYSAAGGSTLVSADEAAYGYPHAQLLTGLTPNTTYTYRVISADRSGNQSSVSKTFKTRGPVGKTFYVSPTGSDTNTGTIDKPFKTIEKARDTVRALRPLPTGGVQILLRGGVYPRTAAFVLTAADSGTTDAPIQYRAYNNEEVRISGAKEITGFVPNTNPRIRTAGVLQVNLRDNGVTDFGTRQNSGAYLKTGNSPLNLIFQDKMMTLARYPNENKSDLYSELIKINNTPDPTKTFTFTDGTGRLSRWATFADVWVHGNWYFNHRHSVLKTTSIVNSGNNTYTVTAPGDQTGMKADRPFFFMNVMEEIDTPGEWYLDNATGILYFYPPASINSSKAFVTVANDLVDINAASNVIFTGIIFENARGKAFDMDQNSTNIMVENSIIRNVSIGAIIAGKHNGIWGSKIYNTEDNGVVLFGGRDITLEGGYNYVTNNEIYNFATLNKSYRAAVNMTGIDTFVTTLGPSSGVSNRVRYNYIHDGPHFGIVGGGNNLLVDSNEVTRVCKETIDCGAIYFVSPITRRGTMIKYNYVHNIFGFDFERKYQLSAVALYIDNDTGGISVFGNVVDNVDVAILDNGGRDNEFQNNAVSNVRNRSVYFDASGLTFTNKNFRIPIIAVSKTTPMEITLARKHMNSSDYEYRPKDTVKVISAEGETGINGEWKFETNPATPNKMKLLGTVPTGDYTGGGYLVQTDTTLNYLAKYNYTQAPYASFYPRLTRALLEVDDAEPKGILIEKNAFTSDKPANITTISQKYVKFDASNIVGASFSPTNLSPLYARGLKPIPFNQIGLVKGDTLPPVNPPVVNKPTVKLTDKFDVTLDKASYKIGSNIHIKAVFSLNSAWVKWFKDTNQSQAELAFNIDEQKILFNATLAFNVVDGPVTLEYDWKTAPDVTFAGKTVTLQTSVYDANREIIEKNTTTKVKFDTTIPADTGEVINTVFQPANTTPKDLVQNMENEIKSRITSLADIDLGMVSNGNKYKSLYTQRGSLEGPWVRNPNVWTNNIAPLDLTGHSPWYGDKGQTSQGGSYQGGATLISPIHIISASHITNQIPVGKKVVFVTKDNQTVIRTVVKSKVIPNTSTNFPDITVALLDERVPDSIAYYPIVSTTAWKEALKNEIPDTWSDTRGTIPMIYLDQEDRVSVGMAIKDNLRKETYPSFSLSRDTTGRYGKLYEDVVIGDSSNPLFAVIGGKLALMTLFTSPGNGSDYAKLITTINAAMAELGGGYKVSELNLSGFTSGATQPRPTEKLTSSLVLETDKKTYNINETVKNKVTFTLNPAWITWLKNKGQTKVVVHIDAVTDTNITLYGTDFPVDITGNQVIKTYDFVPPIINTLSNRKLRISATIQNTESSISEAAVLTDVKFALNMTLQVSKTGVGSGTVTGTGIDCGKDCSEIVVAKSAINLEAKPAAGSVFTGWSGECTGTGACAITAQKATIDIIANFAKENTAPKAKNTTYTAINGVATVTLDASDDQNDPILFTPAAPTHGTLTKISEGRYTYTLKDKTVNGITDTFTFTASDGTLTSAPATITINIPKIVVVNTAPVANDASYNVINNTVNITLTASDPQGDALMYTPNKLVLPNGTLVKTAEGKYTYTGTTKPATDVTDTFTFTATDGKLTSAPATIRINISKTPVVNTAPKANSAVVNVVNGVANITLTASDSEGDAIAYTGPTNLVLKYGSLKTNGVAKYIYTVTAQPTTTVSDIVTFTATDGKLTSAPATITINVPKYIPADADADGISDANDLCANTPVTLKSKVDAQGCIKPKLTTFDIAPTTSVGLKNVKDVEIGKTNVAKIQFTDRVNLSRDTEELDIDANVIISAKKVQIKSAAIPELNKPAIITFYNVTEKSPKILRDGVVCNPPQCVITPKGNGVITVTVKGFSTYEVVEGAQTPAVNTAPTVNALTVSADPDTTITLTGTDAENDTLTYTVNSSAITHGTLTGSGATYTFTTTDTNRSTDLVDTFTYTASDGKLTSVPATVTINIPKKTIIDTIVDTVKNVVSGGGGGGGSGGAIQVTPSAPEPTPNTITKVLAIGSTGEEVRDLQRMLNGRGFRVAFTGAGSPGKESTYFGPATKAALIKYQLSKGLLPTGVYSVIISTTPSVVTTTVTFTRNLNIGSTGNDVKRLQQILNSKGFIIATTGAGSPGNESTYFGAKTAQALKKFQSSRGINPVGYVGPVTRAALNTI